MTATKRKEPVSERRLRAALFLARFLVLAIPFYFLLGLNIDFRPLQKIVANNVALLLSGLGIAASVNGYLVGYGKVILEITGDCTAWKDMVAFVSMIIAVPGVGWKKRLKGFALLPLIYAVNITRLASLLILGNWRPEFLSLVHNVLWIGGTLLFMLLLWAVWLKGFK